MNVFSDDLKFSHTCEDLACWREIYESAFPTMAAMVNHRQDGQHQRAGIDRSVVLESGKHITIDEKVRRKNYGDILLEYIANDKTGAPGWVEKSLLCDYIAYAVMTTGKAYLLPVPQLQAAWMRYRDEWIPKHRKIVADNRHYKTISLAVPIDALFGAIGQCLRVKFTPVIENSPSGPDAELESGFNLAQPSLF